MRYRAWAGAEHFRSRGQTSWTRSLGKHGALLGVLLAALSVAGCAGSGRSREPGGCSEASCPSGRCVMGRCEVLDAGAVVSDDASDGRGNDASGDRSSSEVCGNGLDDDGDGLVEEGCTDCREGATQSCYAGDPALAGVGACAMGEQVCETNGEFAGGWSMCAGWAAPQDEACDNEIDDDCDGSVDEADCRLCEPGETRSCYEGPAGTEGVGVCAAGTQRCDETGAWGSCEGQTLPSAEDCDDGADNDCSGEPDDEAACAPSCEATSRGFVCDAPGEYEVVIPDTVREVQVEAWGGGGGGGSHSTGFGGGSGFAGATIDVVAGQRLQVHVAEGGEEGGAGGGASYVLRDDGLAFVVAAGGGGGASDGCSGCSEVGGAGGAGGGAVGEAGQGYMHPSGYGMSSGGQGGTQSAGGSGGTADPGTSGTTCVSGGEPGDAHAGGRGGGGGPPGFGAEEDAPCNPDRGADGAERWEAFGGDGNGSGGGGGAGWYGGGGGGGRWTYYGGGGGGGSSYAHPSTRDSRLIGGGGPAPGNTTTASYAGGAGRGGDPNAAGNPGLVVIGW